MKNINPFTLTTRSGISLILALILCVSMNSKVFAQGEPAIEKAPLDIGEVEVTHDATNVQAMMVPQPDNPVIDTVLAFSRPGSPRALVKCVGYTIKGVVSGRARTIVPANGVAFILASDLGSAGPGRFVGSARCYSTSEVAPTAYLTGPNFEALQATTSEGWNRTTIFFPLIATL